MNNPPPGDLIATLAGRKFLDANGNGCLDSSETPLEGWTVCLEQKNGNGTWVPVLDENDNQVCDETGPEGEFTFEDLPVPMTYRISETPKIGWLQTGPNTDPDEECLHGQPSCSDPCASIQVIPSDADVTVIAKDGMYIVNFGEIADVQTEVLSLNFGNALAEICVEKTEACSDRPLAGFTFTLWDCACEVEVTKDALGNDIEPIVSGGDDDCWTNLLAGSYCVKETLTPGWDSVGPTEKCVTVEAGGSETASFCNWAPCMGLTPGYWKNWRNHYTSEQFCVLLEGTIADVGDCTADIAAADAIFEHWDASPGDELTIMKAFLLADQLTLNLTQLPGMPNPSDGSLVPECSLDYNGTPIVLSEVIEAALCCIAPDGCSREDILQIKNWLAAFAEARMSTCPCIP